MPPEPGRTQAGVLGRAGPYHFFCFYDFRPELENLPSGRDDGGFVEQPAAACSARPAGATEEPRAARASP